MHESDTLLAMDLEGAPDLGAPSGEPALATRRTARVLLVFRQRDEVAATILRGIAHYQQSHGDWSVQIDDRPRSTAELRWQLAQGWDGVISRHTSQALVEACAEFRVPLVDLDDGPRYAGVSKVRCDHAAAGAMGAECFLDRGFRSFGFVGCGEQARARERQAGFVEAVRLGGHEPLELELEAGEWNPVRGEREGRVLAEWLQQLPKPVAVMACDDRRAAQVLEAARAARCLVPEEVAVLGVDNDVVRCELSTPTLSSVDPGFYQVGFRAAEHLHRRLQGTHTPVCDLRVDPAGVVFRKTTDSIAIPDRAVAAAVRHIAAHGCEGLTVDAVLAEVGVSRSQLEKKFRHYLGRSPQAEIRRVQVARVRQLLVETDLPLKGIAELTGYDYTEYMCVVFRRLTGETPGAYRRRHRPRGCAAPPEHGRAA